MSTRVLSTRTVKDVPAFSPLQEIIYPFLPLPLPDESFFMGPHNRDKSLLNGR
jgi:hypothetical protein